MPVAAAVELFYENGYQNTTLEIVANRRSDATRTDLRQQFRLGGEVRVNERFGHPKPMEAIDSILRLRVPPTEKLRLLGERFVTAVL